MAAIDMTTMGVNPYTGRLESGSSWLPVNSHGQIWTVAGSGFGTKSRQSPVIWDTFSNATADGTNLKDVDPTWVPYNGTGAYYDSTYPRYVGQKSAANKRRGSNDFHTNYKDIPQTRKVYYSHYARIDDWIDGLDGGVIKLARINSNMANQPGGGRYNGFGSTQLGGATAGAYFNQVDVGYAHQTEVIYPKNTWMRYEHELYIGDPDIANGYYKVTANETQVLTASNIISQSAVKPVRTDTILLGIEIANPRVRYEINTLQANTVYSLNFDGQLCSYTSSANPTKNQILLGIKQAVYDVWLPIITAAGTEINPAQAVSGYVYVVGDKMSTAANSVITTSANINICAVPYPQIKNADIYVDTDNTGRFVIGNTATYATCSIREPQPYIYWSDTLAKFKVFAPTVTGDKYLFFISDAGVITPMGKMNDNGSLA